MLGYYLIGIACVFGTATGQVLFKLSANLLRDSGHSLNSTLLLTLFSAFAIYGTVTLVWVWLLQKVPLGRLYPLMALTLILVPLGGYLVFGEQFPPQYFLGLLLIIAGTLIVVKNKKEN